MIIGVDVDGVLADFNRDYIEKVIDLSGRDLFPARPFDIPCWSYPEHYGYTRREVSEVWTQIKLSANFWVNLQGYPSTEGFLEFLDSLDGNNDIYFVTSRVGIRVKHQTETWLYEHGFNKPTVLISSEKGLCANALKMDYYIDDKNENVRDVVEVSGADCFMLAQPWNESQFGCVRVDSIVDFQKVLKEALGEY